MKEDTDSHAYKIMRKQAISRKTGKCSRCPIHGGENWRKKPKADKYKDKRKGRC